MRAGGSYRITLCAIGAVGGIGAIDDRALPDAPCELRPNERQPRKRWPNASEFRKPAAKRRKCRIRHRLGGGRLAPPFFYASAEVAAEELRSCSKGEIYYFGLREKKGEV